MHIVFAGVEPSIQLQQALREQSFTFENAPNFVTAASQRPELSLKCDWLIAACQETKTLELLDSASEALTAAWVTLAVPAAWLVSAEKQTALLRCQKKSEVLPIENWEAYFWLSLQRLEAARKRHSTLAGLQRENAELTQLHIDLAARVKKLLAALEEDVALAGSIQKALLPRATPEIPGVAFSVKYYPSMGSGGDYFDIFEFGDKRRFGVLLADSESHSVAAALLGILIKIRLEEVRSQWPGAKEFVQFLHDELKALPTKGATTLSLLYALVDRSTLELQYSCAGNLKPILWRSGKLVDIPVTSQPPLGRSEAFRFTDNQVRLEPGDQILFFSGGLLRLLGNESALPSFLQQAAPVSGDPGTPLDARGHLLGLVDAWVAERGPLEEDITLIHFALDDQAAFVPRVLTTA